MIGPEMSEEKLSNKIKINKSFTFLERKIESFKKCGTGLIDKLLSIYFNFFPIVYQNSPSMILSNVI
jgi:hypothetical protein